MDTNYIIYLLYIIIYPIVQAWLLNMIFTRWPEETKGRLIIGASLALFTLIWGGIADNQMKTGLTYRQHGRSPVQSL